MFKNLFKERELGDKIILVNDISSTGTFGDKAIIPKGTICINYGRPSPFYKYDESFIELKLINPIVDGTSVIDRLVVKRKSKDIETYE